MTINSFGIGSGECEECGNSENISCGTNPFNPSLNLWLCQKCEKLPFFELKNVKYFDASTMCCEGNANFKKATYSEEDEN